VLAAGLFLAPPTIAMLLVGQLTGVLDRIVGSKATLIVRVGCSAAPFAWLTTSPETRVAIYLISAILGSGSAWPSPRWRT
jgi:hypothetical protein